MSVIDHVLTFGFTFAAAFNFDRSNSNSQYNCHAMVVFAVATSYVMFPHTECDSSVSIGSQVAQELLDGRLVMCEFEKYRG